MTAILATSEPCYRPREPSASRCALWFTLNNECANCQGDGTRFVIHPDTPAISVEAAKELVDKALSRRYFSKAPDGGDGHFLQAHSANSAKRAVTAAIESNS